MNNTKLTNWLLATLTAVLMAIAGISWTNITQANLQIATLQQRAATVEQSNLDTLRRLDRIEIKLDILIAK